MNEPKPLPSETKLVERLERASTLQWLDERRQQGFGPEGLIESLREYVQEAATALASLADELRAHETVMRLLFERFPDCQALGDLPGWVDELKDELRLAQTELKGCYRIIDELKEEL